jgi:hypothetical protein
MEPKCQGGYIYIYWLKKLSLIHDSRFITSIFVHVVKNIYIYIYIKVIYILAIDVILLFF